MKIPTIVIFGRPNVGKSTIFNRLTNSKIAIVDSKPGVTRDRNYSKMTIDNNHYILVDTGGFSYGSEDVLQKDLNNQVDLALKEADLILWVVDAQAGCLPEDRDFAQKLRLYDKNIIVCINKSESFSKNEALQDFYCLGYSNLCPISSSHNQGFDKLKQGVLNLVVSDNVDLEDIEEGVIKVAVIGRPNVGKSTFINKLLKTDRMIVSDVSGTTRDSIDSKLIYKQQRYNIIDTAGVRRKSKIIKRDTEAFSVVRTLKSVEKADVIIIMFDSSEGVTDQDCQLISYVVDSGRGLVLVFNKSDLIDNENDYELQYSIDKRLSFINFTKPLFCCAKNNKGISQVMKLVKATYMNTQKRLSTSQLTKWLENAQKIHQPPVINSRRIKLRFAHMSNGSPPYIVIHGKQLDKLPNHYKKYLENSLRDTFGFDGVPIRLSFKVDENPYI